MFVRVKKIGPYEYLYLVENAREGGRHVRNRQLSLRVRVFIDWVAKEYARPLGPGAITTPADS